MTGLRERKKTERSREILAAAAQVFQSKGFEGARIEEIARQADVAPATVYNHFPTKDQLLLALVQLYRLEFQSARRRLVENPPDDPTDALRRFYDVLLRRSLKYLDKPNWRHVQAVSMLHSWGTENAMWHNEQRLLEEQVAILTTLQARGCVPAAIDCRILAENVHAIGYFCWQRFLSDPEMTIAEVKAAFTRQLDFLFRHLGVSPARAPREPAP